MENTYGIGIANRYELFYDQDDVVDFETVITKKKKSKEPATAQQTPAPASAVQQKSAAEKENKQVKKETGTGQQKATPDQQRRGIKEQSNNSNKDAAPRKDGDKGFTNSRPAFNKTGGNPGENREERNNRRNREMNGNVDFEKQPRTGGAVGQRNPNRRNFDGKRDGKRERDRQSGSDKTGVKSVDKRDGGGAHNWGSHKQDIDDLNKPPTDDENKEGSDGNADDSTPTAPVEEEPKEMTLDEWKAQRQAQLLQPQYNLRKAGEGEDNAQWDKMKRLDKKIGDGEVGRKDDSAAAAKKEADAKKKQVLDIEFHFNDGRRGGLGRRPNTGGRGGPGGPGQNRRPRPQRDNADESHGGEGGEQRERRPPRERRPRFENNRRGDYHGHGHDAPHAPKVDDERDFPSLG